MRIIIVAVFFVVSYPCQILADECDTFKAEADRIFKKAQVEYKQEKFDDSMELYERAKRYYRRLSEMECQPGVSEYAGKGFDTCKKNIAHCEENLKKQKKRKAEAEAVEQFNQATKRFNEGGQLKKQRQWDEAKVAFEEAANIWSRIASGETDIAEKAKPRVEKAKELANQAQKRSEIKY